MKLVSPASFWKRRRAPSELVGAGSTLAPASTFGDSMSPSAAYSFRELAESLPQVVWTCRPTGEIDYLSPHWTAITGGNTADGLDFGWVDRVHPDDRQRVFSGWQRAFDARAVYAVDLRLQDTGGAYRWYQSRAVPVLDAAGEVTRWIGATTDVHHLHEAHARLRDEHERLKAFADTVPTILCTYRIRLDGHGCVPFGAERLSQLYDIPADVLERDCAAIGSRIHPEDMARMGKAMAESARSRQAWRMEFRVPDTPRGPLWLEAHFAPMRLPEADGSQTWHGSITDITARKHAEAETRRLNTELEQRVRERTAELEAAVKEQEAFSFSVSHDLRAPLRAMEGFSQLLQKNFGSAMPEPGQRYLQIICDSARKMDTLIGDLLSFSRLGRAPMHAMAVDMAALVEDALQTLAPLRAGRRIALRVGALPPAAGDPAMLRQVWVNLLSNALKYTRQRDAAVVEVSGERHGDRVRYRIADNGTGFDMRHAHKLFGVFERLHRSEEFDGTGVGLAIVQRIVHRHGGEVTAEGRVDEGAAFSFERDAAPGPAAAAGEPRPT